MDKNKEALSDMPSIPKIGEGFGACALFKGRLFEWFEKNEETIRAALHPPDDRRSKRKGKSEMIFDFKEEIKAELAEMYSDYLDGNPFLTYTEYLEGVCVKLITILICAVPLLLVALFI